LENDFWISQQVDRSKRLSLCFLRTPWSNTYWFGMLCIKLHCRPATTTTTTTTTTIWHAARLYAGLPRRGLSLPFVPVSSSSTASSQPSTSYPSARERWNKNETLHTPQVHTYICIYRTRV